MAGDTQATEGQQIVVELRAMRHVLNEIRALLADRPAGQASGPSVAPNADLDGPHGDPVIKAKDPRDYLGPPMTGRKFSETTPEYLDLLADRYEYFNTQTDDATKRRYNTLDCARARGWAARLRAGWTPPASRVEPTPPAWSGARTPAPASAPAWPSAPPGWGTGSTDGDPF